MICPHCKHRVEPLRWRREPNGGSSWSCSLCARRAEFDRTGQPVTGRMYYAPQPGIGCALVVIAGIVALVVWWWVT